MRNFKRILNIVLVMAMLFVILSVSAFAIKTKFSDISEKDQVLSQAVSLLDGIGVAKGVSDTSYSPKSEVTRQQMAAFVYRLMKEGKSIEEGENTTSFTDLYDETFNGMISWASYMGIIKGVSETEFNPDGGIILQDAYVMLVRALGYEKEAPLSYPIGYIDIAEGLDLGKGLSSSITYTTPLTRGDIAIILYNAFYAEMAEKQVVQYLEYNDGEYNKKTKSENIKLCEKIYGVTEENFVVRETTRYAFNDSKNSDTYKPTQDSMGDGTMFLVDNPKDGVNKLHSFYATAEELGLSNNADTYIMSEVTVFYKYNETTGEVEKIFHSQDLMAKNSVSTVACELVPSSKRANDPENRYSPYTSSASRRLSGEVTVGGKSVYFYDAPYSYLKPSYEDCVTDEDRYNARNEDNAKFIDLKCLDVNKALYSYYITSDVFASKDGYNTPYDGALANKMKTARSSGIYSVDVYDPDGDGRYEYMWYRPASFGQMNMTKSKTFYKDGMDNKFVPDNRNTNDPDYKPQIYANGATLSGAAFNNGDFVIAYVNPDANMIHIHGVATGREGLIVGNRYNTGTVSFGSYSLRTCYQYEYVENFFMSPPSNNRLNMYKFLTSNAALGVKVRMYTYTHGGNNNVMYYEIISGSNAIYSGESLLIPLEIETVIGRDSNYKAIQYLKVLVDGERKYVEVDVENSYPNPRLTVNETYKFDNTVEDENGQTYNVYLGKLCTYTVGKDGKYTLKSLMHSQDENGAFDHVPLVFNDETFFSKENSTMVANDLGADEKVQLKRMSSTRYKLLDGDGNDMFGTYGTTPVEGHWFKQAYVDDDTVFMIRATETDGNKTETKLYTYTGETFPATIEGKLSNVQYIYRNRGNSEEDVELVLFYGEVDGELKFVDATNNVDYRIVQYSRPVKIDDDEFRYSYTLLNPATGETTEDVIGLLEKKTISSLVDNKTLADGSIVYLTKNGNVDDREASKSIINADTNKNLAFILDAYMDEYERSVKLLPVNSPADNEYFTVDKTLYDVYTVAEDATISVIKYTDKSDITTATINSISFEQLVGLGEELKSYNDKVIDHKENINKEYAKYVKAYITYTKKSQNNYPVIDSIIVVVNADEPEKYLDIEE